MQPLDTLQLPVEYRRVGFGKRLVAFIIDVLITMVLGIGLGFALYAMDMQVSLIDRGASEFVSTMYRMLGMSKADTQSMLQFSGVLAFAALIVGFLYSIIELFTGASIGKMALGIVIAHADGRRGELQLWFNRWVLKNLNSNLNALALIPALSILSPISTVIGILFIIGCFFALGESRLALHDRIAQTAVFHKDDVQ